MSTLIPAEVFSPGEYLRDELQVRGWTERDFAEVLGRPVQLVSEILNGRKRIVGLTAVEIGEALGSSPDLWMNLQAAFDLYQARAAAPAVSKVAARARLLTLLPMRELRQRRWLPDTSDAKILTAAACELLGVNDLDEEPPVAMAARRASATVAFTPQQLAWTARVRTMAQTRDVAHYDRTRLASLASDLAHLLADPSELAQLTAWLADVGVVLVLLAPLRSSKLDGVSMVLADGRPVIGLTGRGDRFDGFIFTLLHEIAHLTLDHVKAAGLRADEDILGSAALSDVEEAANHRAASWILPTDFVPPAGRASLREIREVAAKFHIHPGLVIGRIQRDRQEWALHRSAIPKVRRYLSFDQ